MTPPDTPDVGYFQSLRIVWHHLTGRRRRQLALLGGLTIVATFAEMLSIAAILPFLSLLAAPQRVMESPYTRPLLEALNIAGPQDLLLPLTAFFVVAAAVSGALRLTMSWAQARLSHAIGIDLSVEIYERTLYQPYSVHAANNTSRVLTVVSNKSLKLVIGIILPTLNLIAGASLFLAITLVLLAFAPGLALSLIGSLGVIYGLVLLLLRARVRANGDLIAREMSRSMQVLQEGLGGIRDVLLDGSQPMHVRRLAASITPMRRATADNTFLGAAPRFVIETIGLIVLAGVAFMIAQRPGGIEAALPVLGTIALAAQRLLPVAQQAYSAWTLIRGSRKAVSECLEYLAFPLPDAADERAPSLPFQRSIRFEAVDFSYSPDTPAALKSVDLELPRGIRVGIIGPTGSGKSTLVDILMGLLSPTGGALTVDGTPIDATTRRAWQKHIAHVPQAIFLTDSTLASNIAFGVPADQIDMDRVREVVERAQLSETVARLPEGLDTVIGERGIRLSGGQRQRIGIARALYRQADVIVFDEATSALDTETEQRVMQAIESLDRDLTLIMIAHRVSTLRNCDLIVQIEDGRIARTGSAAALLAEASTNATAPKHQVQ